MVRRVSKYMHAATLNIGGSKLFFLKVGGNS
jgi:hypothetical protein